MSLVDGKALAANLEAQVREAIVAYGKPLRLAIVTCAPNLATRSYLSLKEKVATAVGVLVVLEVLPDTANTSDCIAAVVRAAERADGVIVQLPLLSTIDTAAVLAAIPASHDVDNFRYQGESTEVLPPVVGAIDYIAQRANLNWSGAAVVVLGTGRLVGAPAARFAASAGARVTVVTPQTDSMTKQAALARADIIILGVGQARTLLPEMVKAGVAVFDAGASEDGGVLVGDADSTVATKASLFTPVPGGIGPLTVVLLFRNLLVLALRQ